MTQKNAEVMQERNKIRIETIRKDKSILKITSRSTVESHVGELKIDIQVSTSLPKFPLVSMFVRHTTCKQKVMTNR